MKKNITLKYILLFLISMCQLTVMAQNIESLEKKGDEAYYNLDIDNAIKFYNKANEAKANDPKIMEKLANAYFISNNKSTDALNIYNDLFAKGIATPKAMAKYASMLTTSGNFDEATKVYQKLFPNKSIDANYFKNLASPNPNYKVKNVLALNTNLSDFSPMYYKKGLAFISTRKKRDNIGWDMKNNIYEYYTDAFYSTMDDQKSFSDPKTLLNIKSEEYMQGPMSFANEEGVMYITRSNTVKQDIQKASDKKTVNLKIYRVNYSGSTSNWTDASEVVLNKAPNAADFSYAHPAFSPDYNTLYFASNMPGGFGGTDIWKVTKVGNDWDIPVNLGPEINTVGEEKFPYISKDSVLYFASDGLPGIGGLDIFKATKVNGMYSQPTNMGAPLNTKMDDFGLIIDKDNQSGYLASNRLNTGLGEDDIYSWENSQMNLTVNVVDKKTGLPIPNSDIKISCIDKKVTSNNSGSYTTLMSPTKECIVESLNPEYKPYSVTMKNINSSKIITLPLEAVDKSNCIKMKVIVLDKSTNQPIDNANLQIAQTVNAGNLSGSTVSNGQYSNNCVPVDNFQITVCKDNADGTKYICKTEVLSTKGKNAGDEVTTTIYLEKGEIGKTFKIDNIYYDLSKWFIRPDAARELDKIVKMMNDNPTMEIELGSHTDCRSSAQFNMDLSEKRAQSARQYIVSRGIANNRITGKGYGESMLVNGCSCEGAVKSTCSEVEHQQNRRTEFKILKF